MPSAIASTPRVNSSRDRVWAMRISSQGNSRAPTTSITPVKPATFNSVQPIDFASSAPSSESPV